MAALAGGATVSSVGTGVASATSDLFAGSAAKTSGYAQATGLRIQAAGTRLNAQGLRLKSAGDLAEASEYDLAGGLATENAQFTAASSAIQQAQQDRALMQSLGSTTAAVGGSGFTMSGSALDIMRDSAAQGALTKQVLGAQGQITEVGYKEEAQSYGVMSSASRYAASEESDMATKTDAIAGQQDALASEEEAAARKAQKNSYITAGIKIAAVVASVAATVFTGGAAAPLAAAAIAAAAKSD